jgi:hypothetical protein
LTATHINYVSENVIFLSELHKNPDGDKGYTL